MKKFKDMICESDGLPKEISVNGPRFSVGGRSIAVHNLYWDVKKKKCMISYNATGGMNKETKKLDIFSADEPIENFLYKARKGDWK